MGETEKAPSANGLVPGTRIDDKYELTWPLDSGGMGSVWRARHVSLGHAVAIKFLQATGTGSDARARFDREARVAARLGESTRHITRVIDHGMFEDATPYLVMELLKGETLSSRLMRQGRLHPAVATELTLQLCRALEAAHAAGVVHRDIKPSNVFLCTPERDESVLLKLMDFGVAKARRESEEEPSTRSGMAIGTPSYMSPEQILAKPVDPRSDLWAVGAVVYRMVTGRTPFGHGSVEELGLRILMSTPMPPSCIVTDLPKSLDLWIAKALAKSPDERFQSARDLGDALAIVTRGAQSLELARTPPWLAPVRGPTTGAYAPVIKDARASQPPTLREIPIARWPSKPPAPRPTRARAAALAWLVLPVAIVGVLAIGPRFAATTSERAAREQPATTAATTRSSGTPSEETTAASTNGAASASPSLAACETVAESTLESIAFTRAEDPPSVVASTRTEKTRTEKTPKPAASHEPTRKAPKPAPASTARGRPATAPTPLPSAPKAPHAEPRGPKKLR